jgi:hypothetical protein
MGKRTSRRLIAQLATAELPVLSQLCRYEPAEPGGGDNVGLVPLRVRPATLLGRHGTLVLLPPPPPLPPPLPLPFCPDAVSAGVEGVVTGEELAGAVALV